ncbi:conserved hypothetical protein [Microscilla marina ATCC 23134]|uniref:Sulfatase-modifying factor enzyme-like domain-containing protein n=2 Tax=Microscilla marina TaxID=1027 RepID=A1ZSZ1_MICM2|nr:conserved hypothetical protein [Microscilla marina ATCC 23134]
MWMKKFFVSLLIGCLFFSLPYFTIAQYKKKILIPKGMVLMPADTIEVGSENGKEDEKPVFPFAIKSFLLDVRPVSVGDFRKFVQVTRYITDAEKIGKSYYYNKDSKNWEAIKGAYWLYPQGRTQAAAQYADPVAHISWNDARAYAAWIGKRLPTEFEYEYAAKNAVKMKLKHINQTLWHWCQDWYRSYGEESYYTQRINDRKTLRGGVFGNTETPYRPTQRLAALPYYSTAQFGFRCAKDL